jgi:hypothetical protein
MNHARTDPRRQLAEEGSPASPPLRICWLARGCCSAGPATAYGPRYDQPKVFRARRADRGIFRTCSATCAQKAGIE